MIELLSSWGLPSSCFWLWLGLARVRQGWAGPPLTHPHLLQGLDQRIYGQEKDGVGMAQKQTSVCILSSLRINRTLATLCPPWQLYRGFLLGLLQAASLPWAWPQPKNYTVHPMAPFPQHVGDPHQHGSLPPSYQGCSSSWGSICESAQSLADPPTTLMGYLSPAP